MNSLRLALLAVGLIGLAACGEGGGGKNSAYGLSNCNSQNVRYEPILSQFVRVPGGQVVRCNIPTVSCSQLGLRQDGYNAGWGGEIRWFDRNGRYVPNPNCREAVEATLFALSGGMIDPQTYAAQSGYDPVCNDPRLRNTAQYNQRCLNMWNRQNGQSIHNNMPQWAQRDPIYGGGAYAPYVQGPGQLRQPRQSCTGVYPFKVCAWIY